MVIDKGGWTFPFHFSLARFEYGIFNGLIPENIGGKHLTRGFNLNKHLNQQRPKRATSFGNKRTLPGGIGKVLTMRFRH